MKKQNTVCTVCADKKKCQFANISRIVCHFAMLHFEFSLPPTCFDCVDFETCVKRYNFNKDKPQYEFRCTGLKIQLKEPLPKVVI